MTQESAEGVFLKSLLPSETQWSAQSIMADTCTKRKTKRHSLRLPDEYARGHLRGSIEPHAGTGPDELASSPDRHRSAYLPSDCADASREQNRQDQRGVLECVGPIMCERSQTVRTWYLKDGRAPEAGCGAMYRLLVDLSASCVLTTRVSTWRVERDYVDE